MPIEALLTQTGTVRRRGVTGTDGYGNDVAGTTSTYETPCFLEQTDATEILVDRETYVSSWRLFLPAGSELSAADQFVLDGRGDVFEVVGEPDRLWHPVRRVEHHVEARLTVVIG